MGCTSFRCCGQVRHEAAFLSATARNTLGVFVSLLCLKFETPCSQQTAPARAAPEPQHY